MPNRGESAKKAPIWLEYDEAGVILDGPIAVESTAGALVGDGFLLRTANGVSLIYEAANELSGPISLLTREVNAADTVPCKGILRCLLQSISATVNITTGNTSGSGIGALISTDPAQP